MASTSDSSGPKTYEARFVSDPNIVLDGVVDEPAWKKAIEQRDFFFPWKECEAPSTEFRALHDGWSLYFSFQVDDDDIVLVEDFQRKEDVIVEDRVELLFALDESLETYFCMEMDPLGRVLDYRSSYYRKFDFRWSFPGLQVAGKPRDQGYVVEGSIPFSSFESLGFGPLESGRPIKFGMFRAEFSHGPGAEPIENWMSWVDPGTEEPDFHVPSAFGYLTLGTESV